MKIALHYSKKSAMLLFNWLVQGTVAIICFTFLHFCYLYLMPSNWVFNYISIEPTQTAFEHFETIKMKTTADWHRDAEVLWVDTLRCPPVHFISQSESKGFKKEWDKARGEWYHGKETPILDTECYIEVTIVATIEYGIKKIQTLQSPNFLIH